MEKSFRIVLNLNNYFHDHRSFARIFINEKIQSIGDLQNRVRDVFGIDNFYLVSQNHYLPPTEDVRLLSKDDLIWVIPDPSQATQPVEEEAPRKKKSKKRETVDEATTNNVEEIEEEVTSKRKKKVSAVDTPSEESQRKVKKKKHRDKRETIPQPNFDEEPDDDNNKKEVEEKENEEVEEEMDVDEENGKSESMYEPRGLFQAAGVLPERKRITLPTATEDYLKKKRVNVVKIERVEVPAKFLNGDVKVQESNHKQSINKQDKVLNNEVEESTSKVQPSIVKEVKVQKNEDVQVQVNNTGNNKEESAKTSLLDFIKSKRCSFNSGISSTTPDLPLENCPKFNVSGKTEEPAEAEHNLSERLSVDLPKMNDSMDITNLLAANDQTVEETINGDDCSLMSSDANQSDSNASYFSLKRHMSGVAHLLSDLKSSDLDNSVFGDVLGGQKRKRVRTRKRKKKDSANRDSSFYEAPPPKPLTLNGAPKMHIKFEEEEDNDVSVKSELPTQEVINVDESTITINDSVVEPNFDPNFMLDEANILSQPLMTNMTPKPLDLVIFKILRMAEDYTPTLSSYIVAKILNFNQDTKEVECKIIYGADQCVISPAGKFALDAEEEEEEEEQADYRKFSWHELYLPRLLYP